MKEEKKYLEGTRIEDLRGKKFGRLTVIDFDLDRYEKDKLRKEIGDIGSISKYWTCICDCGKLCCVNGGNLRTSHTSTCGVCYTFKDWCIDNDRHDLLRLWDYELNDKKPSEVAFKSRKKYYFKCPRSIHESINVSISNVTRDGKIYCLKCNSFGQWCIDSDNLDLLGMWCETNTKMPMDVCRSSRYKAIMKCKDCGNVKSVITYMMYMCSGICCYCGDGRSYPEKFMINIVNQIGEELITEYSPKWATDDNGSQRRYDFYIPSKNLIIEMDGDFHYKDNTMSKQTKEESKAIDDWKDMVAFKNGIRVVRIDSRKSDLKWIKQSVINSELPKLLNFKEDDIDWIKCNQVSLKNSVLEVYRLQKYKKKTYKEISKIVGIAESTVCKYLAKARDIYTERGDSLE